MSGGIETWYTPAAPGGERRPPLVFLHEGLGSLGLWKGFPALVRERCGAPASLVYSRPGYGTSEVVPPPWPVEYLHHEALDVLPALLARLGIERPVLIGHSDGASIALLHAGAGHPVAGLVLLGPHVFVEDRSIAGIEAARDAYLKGGLRRRLERHHADVDATFWGWNGVWLSPEFRDWNIEHETTGVTAPVLAIQGSEDEYGTLAQLDAIEAGVQGPFERLVLPGAGHALLVGRDADLVAGAIAGFVRQLGPPG